MLRRNRTGFRARRGLPEGGAADPVSVLIATGLTILLAAVAVLFTL